MASHRIAHLGRRSGVTVIAAALEIAAMAVFGLTQTHHDILGTTGAIAVLIAVIAAVLAGPLAGCLTAVAGGVAFLGFVTDWGETAPLTATIGSVVVWSLSALIVGVVADRLRHQESARRAAEDEAVSLHARLESNLLPHLESQHGGLHLLWRYLPSEGRLGISGDFYDAANVPDGRLAVVIGDVVGHGPDAAALGATLRASWHALVLSGASDEQLVSALGGVLAREEPSLDAFVTLCLAWFDSDGCSASLLLLGHPAPLLIAERRVEQVAVQPALPLGLADAAGCAVTRLALPPAWTVLLYTDGLVEGHAGDGSGDRYGLERLIAQLQRETRDGLDERALDRVLVGVTLANGGPLPDDVAVLCVSRTVATVGSETE
jgi:serine phosphatase RsbU (regulator of sigma subunit)